jgi:two-component SAPR family response regulator
MVIKVLLVDDEPPILDELGYLLGKYADVEVMGAFTDPRQAIEYLQQRPAGDLALPDAVFLDIDLPYSNGLETARKMRTINADMIIVFVTAYSAYALESFQVHPLDYLLKPIQESQMDAAVKQIRKQVGLLQAGSRSNNGAIRIKCFGNFSMTVSGQDQIRWGTRRVKDLLMYLIDLEAAPVSHKDLASAIFNGVMDKKAQNNLYVTIHNFRRLLRDIDPKGERLRFQDNMILDIAPGTCDYTDFMSFARSNAVINSGNARAAAAVLQSCRGGYLQDVDYDWAEQTANIVELEYERIALGLARFYLGNSDYQPAETVLLELVARNPISEEGFTLLLDVYIKNDKKQDYILIYEQYTDMLKRELLEEPPEKYTRYYHWIRKA